jgi:hypothetical protein
MLCCANVVYVDVIYVAASMVVRDDVLYFFNVYLASSIYTFLLTFASPHYYYYSLFQSILVEPQFSSVFLNLLLDRRNQLDDLQDLGMSCAPSRSFLFSTTNIGLPIIDIISILSS